MVHQWITSQPSLVLNSVLVSKRGERNRAEAEPSLPSAGRRVEGAQAGALADGRRRSSVGLAGGAPWRSGENKAATEWIWRVPRRRRPDTNVVGVGGAVGTSPPAAAGPANGRTEAGRAAHGGGPASWQPPDPDGGDVL